MNMAQEIIGAQCVSEIGRTGSGKSYAACGVIVFGAIGNLILTIINLVEWICR
jgi:hypothetical protein